MPETDQASQGSNSGSVSYVKKPHSRSDVGLESKRYAHTKVKFQEILSRVLSSILFI